MSAMRNLVIATILLCFVSVHATAQVVLKFAVEEGDGFSLSARGSEGDELYSSSQPNVSHEIILPQSYLAGQVFADVYLVIRSRSGAVIAELKLSVDALSAKTYSFDFIELEQEAVTVENLLGLEEQASSDPLSTFIYIQRLENQSAFQASVAVELLGAYLEYLSLYHLTCTTPNLWTFSSPDQFTNVVDLSSMIERIDPASQTFDPSLAGLWNDRFRLPTGDIQSNLEKMPLCDWHRYSIVERLTRQGQRSSADRYNQHFADDWRFLTDNEQEVVTGLARVSGSRIAEDGRYLASFRE